MSAKPTVVVSGIFDDLRARHLRLLEEAARMGELTVLLWTDEAVHHLTAHPPKFPLAERLYLLHAVRYVSRVIPVAAPLHAHTLPQVNGFQPKVWVDDEHPANSARRASAERHGVGYRVVPVSEMSIFSAPAAIPSAPGRKKVIVTGCYDWFHSGHVRFFEEVSGYGDLYVVVGHDANIRLLKGAGHPLFSQEERRYLTGSIKYVKQALIASGDGWLDADPEIRQLKPDIYAVNEDGDKGGKREYCARMGLEYRVLQRTPAPGIPRRTSTDLRGF